ncbi:hypothetical protein BC629DRAFT_1519613 [Irpex lacteus]|nr:hypothetical protein BC629DRAFT_1519613 [Irpex lacteus]
MSSEIADDSNTNLIDPPFDPDATLADMADILMKMVDDERLEKESLPMSDSQADSDSDTQTLAERSAEEDTPPARNKDATRDPDQEGESTSSSSRNEGVLPLRLDFALLFNFSDRYWVSMVEDQAESGLADEAELCELLGQDGADPSMYTDI